MYPKSLNVSRVLMAVDPEAAHWRHALTLAEGLAEHGVLTTLACVREPVGLAASRAKRIPGLELRHEGATQAGVLGPQEWILFLEMLAKPDVVQLFMPEHVVLPWRTPTVLTLDDSVLSHPHPVLLEAVTRAHLLVVRDDARFEKLQVALNGTPYAAIIDERGDVGWNYLLAYQETVQAASLDLATDLSGNFELL